MPTAQTISKNDSVTVAAGQPNRRRKALNLWLWRWHIIAGLICLPFMLLLTATGIAYMFKANLNDYLYGETKYLASPATDAPTMSYDAMLEAAKSATDHAIMEVYLPESEHQAVGFRVHAHKGDHSRHIIYVDPNSAKVTGAIVQRDTLMYKIRKLHGELLLGKFGTYTVELVASWFLVLLITGLYVWWPAKGKGMKGFFYIRIKEGKRTLFRDMHAVLGFWLSAFLLIILAGGMPWTDVFGSQLKWVQGMTNTGYPEHWQSSHKLSSAEAEHSPPLRFAEMVAVAKAQSLEGATTIRLPQADTGVFSVKNRALLLRDQHVRHFDQYSGKLVVAKTWQDVGILMKLRQVFMRLHQGEYGLFNWIVLLIVATVFLVSTCAGLISYLQRKPAGRWGLPSPPESFKVQPIMVSAIILLGVLFPLFGISLVCIFVASALRSLILDRRQAEPEVG